MSSPTAAPAGSLLAVVGRTPVLVWAGLVLATLISYLLGGEHLLDDRTLTAAIVIGVALVKVWLVGLHFMELRHAPLPLRAVFEAYVVLAFVVLFTLYLVS